MTIKKLPIKLEKEPLLEALFEIRFTSNTPASAIIPGLLFSKLEGDKKIEQLPTAQIPSEIRNTDPNLQFAPTSRLTWNQVHINIGDKNLSISCSSNYPGWESFKSSILVIIEILKGTGIIDSIDRYSIKYINMVPLNNSISPISLVNLDIAIAKHKILNEFFQLRVEIKNNNFVNVVNIISSAAAQLENGEIKQGIIIDIDSIATTTELLTDLSQSLDNIRQINTEMFFDCLTPETIKLLEPVYE
ncbi:MAG: TIGR04255 family protein [Methyloprofundus sp.]|nr:TIGR04255 family protein [Methyloprofundus sp.]MDT8426309.1 TIGR04255 family protein [Methyloprofundus sp.]